jgi:hypothetical protein
MQSGLSNPKVASVCGDPRFPECSRDAAFKRAIGRQADRARNGVWRLFSAAGERLYPLGAQRSPALQREAK